jgi:hypothetical protein
MRRWGWVCCLGVAAASCAEEAPPVVEVGQVEDQGDPDLPEVDAGEDVAAPDLPSAPEIALVEVRVDPGRAVYRPGLNLLPTAAVYDSRGAVVEGAEVAWRVEPPEAAALQTTGRWRVMTEGPLAFVGCVEAVCGRRELISDARGPVIVIEAPAAGAQLSAADGPVELRGRVTDSHGAPQLFYGGQPVPLGAGGEYAVALSLWPGVNHLELTATDGFQPVDTVAAVDVLWSEGYLPTVSGVAGVRLEEGLALHIGRRFLDDGEPLGDVAGQGQVLVRDIAGIIELLLIEIDVLGELPNPLLDSDTARLRLTSFTVEAPQVEVRAVEGGLEVFLRLSGVRLGTSGGVTLEGEEISLEGSIEATASAFVSLRVGKAGRSEPYVVELVQAEIALEEVRPLFLDGDANAVFSFAQSALKARVEEALLDGVVQDLVEELPGLLEGVFSSLDGALTGLSFDLETGLGPPLALRVDAGVRRLVASRAGHLRADMEAEVTAGPTSLHPESRGVGLMRPVLAPFPFFSDRRVQVGVPMELLNGLLHAVWDAGLLDIPVNDVLPPEIGFLLLEAQVKPKLPPVLRAASRPGDPGNDILLTLGQFELHARLAEQEDVYGFQVEVGADLGLREGALEVTLSGAPSLRVWVVSTTGEEARFTPEALKGAVESQLLPLLTEALAEGLRLPLPSIDGGALLELTPSLSEFELVPVQEGPLRFDDGFLIFEGNLQGEAARRR